MRIINFLKKSRTGRFSPIVAVAYGALVHAQLWLETILDQCLSQPSNDSRLDEITAVIKTFERPGKLQRLVRSIKRHYPQLKIIVVDDSKKPSNLQGVTTLTMAFDSGVSAGRNKGLEAVSTQYMLCLDDDFIFNRHTNLMPVLSALEANPDIDLIAGAVIYLPLRIVHDYSRTPVFPTNKTPLQKPGSHIGGLKVHLKVPNFYLARSQKVRLVGWDNRLKRLDHADFFTRAVGIIVSVQNPKFKILHYPTYFNQTYMERKNDRLRDTLILAHKYPQQTDASTPSNSAKS